MLQRSPEQEEMRAFPGPLAKYVLTDFRNNFLAFRIHLSNFQLSANYRF